MRSTIISLAVLTGLIAGIQTASAQSYKWCGINTASSARECGFTTRKQCRATYRQCVRNS
jgi:hypothetical protein